MRRDPSAELRPGLRGLADAPGDPLASSRHTFRFVIIVAAIAAAGLLRSRQPNNPIISSRIPLYISIIALQLLFVWFVNKGIRARGYTLADLIGRCWPRSRAAVIDIALAFAFVFLLRGLTLMLRTIFSGQVGKTAFLLPSGVAESVLWVVVSLVAGSCEELVYRGYLQRQLWAATRSLPIALCLQALIFSLAHVYQGWYAASITAVYGFAFGLLAAWRRSIVPGAIAHATIDIIGGLLHP